MSKTKNDHYLSQCISKNFIQNDNNTFWQYDCSRRILQQKNITKLFSRRRVWGQQFEKMINTHMENDIAPILKRFSNCTAQKKV